MATKISGIKGINITRSSLLTGGTKKTGANDGSRDSANGTTRDNSKNGAALDDAMLKMLLGQTKLLNQRALEIEQKMQIAQKREQDRQEQLAKTLAEREKREIEQAKSKAENKTNKVFDSLNKGLVNGVLSAALGPIGVLAGKAINESGIHLTKIPGKVARLFAGGRSGHQETSDHAESRGGAIGVGRQDLEREPINNLNHTVSSGFKKVIDLMGGRKGDGEGKEKKSLWDKIKDFFKALPGMLQRGWLPKLLGNLLRWLTPLKWLAKLAGLAALAAGFWKLYDWLKGKFGTDWANGLTAGIAKGLKEGLGGIGKTLQKVAKSLKGLKKGAFAAKAAGVASKTLGKLANTGKVGKFLFGNAAKRARAASIAAQKTLQAGKLSTAGKGLVKAGSKIAKFGKVAGAVGNAVIIGESAYSAYNKFKAGDKKGGWGEIGKGAGTLAGSALGAKGGAALGATIGTMIFPGVGTAIGGFLGGVAGAIGGGWLGSKAGGKVAESSYTAITGDKGLSVAESSGSYDTDNDQSSFTDLQVESLGMQNEILNTLKQIELNLNPETQMELDKAYLGNAQSMFKPEPISTTGSGFWGNQSTINFDNPMGV